MSDCVSIGEPRLTIAVRTISYGVSCIFRTLILVRRACRLKPAPGIHVGMCLTREKAHQETAAVSESRKTRHTSRKEVNKDRAWATASDGIRSGLFCQTYI